MVPKMGLRLIVMLGLVLILGSSRSSLVFVKQVSAQNSPPAPPGSSLPPQVGIFRDPPPDLGSFVPQNVFDKFSQSVDDITTQVANNYSFCIQNMEADKKNTFDVDPQAPYLRKCVSTLGVSFIDRVCKKAEIMFYFKHIRTIKFPGAPPNSNCDPDSWSAACEPGWSGLLDGNFSESANVDPSALPVRVQEPQPCCEGFFCPRGLTCMLPCPLGAYCPMATYNETTGSCEPYGYQLSPESTVDKQCGSADLWLTFDDSKGMYCKAGSYCPTTTNKTICSSEHYCRAGSTRESKCSFLSQCDGEGTSSQNLKRSGILLLVAIFIFLLVVYNCSDHLLLIRQRRKSRARELAAREARDNVSTHLTAAERWRVAAMKAVKFSSQLSRQLSRRRSKSVMETPTKGHHAASRSGPLPNISPVKEERDLEDQDFSLLTRSQTDVVHDKPTWSGEPITEATDSQGMTQVDLYDIDKVRTGEEELANSVKEYEVKSESTKAPSTLPTSRTQIYKYAYGQIEKEKQSHQIKDLADVVSSHGFRNMLEGSGRFKIELSFVDLSLFLKGSGKRILSHVSGKFSPCRVTAVMGPSGAGKTTFLNALAGKYTGSRVEGQVLINGQPGSIQSYKKIIGFVPQDDIVHGTLTVEENLWFSAKYRLPVGLAKPDRVLVVERIINTLGLNHIRDSLVGTVERRGISGGQRKRVNVAMELVIEPSLLILDEPTSGLDSTSSRLVLQALRREALWGVNVAVVLHQPSYGLFRMFDDVMFLAKGGWTVYLGPVDDVEDYFAMLGFNVPERINPPDYFMDVLEGVEKHQRDPNFDITTLPTIWMRHKCYNVPAELENPGSTTPLKTTKSGKMAILRKTFSQDVFDDLRVHMAMAWDSFITSFTRVNDLSGRQTPGFFTQYRLIVRRVAKQRFREPRLFAQDFIILLLAGICMGVTADWTDSNLGAKGYTYTIIAISLLVMIASLRTFQMDKINFWRESASGINRLSFFLAKDTVDHFSTVIRPLVYLSMFYFFNDPRSTFEVNYIITLGLVYCVTGIAYILAIFMNPAPAQLSSVFVPVVATLVVIGSRSGVMSKIANLSFAEWALEAYVISNAERYTGVWLINRCGVMASKGYRIGDKWYCLAILFVYGIAARIVALACLFLTNRKRQK